MHRATKKHLEIITEERYEEWRKENAFSLYASSTTKKGLTALGVNGKGEPVVRIARENHPFETLKQAIDFYKDLIIKDKS